MIRCNLFILFVFLLCLPTETNAVPALPKTITVTQSDGSMLQVTLVGDEYCHYYVTSDNIPVVRDEKGNFSYMQIKDSKLTSTGVMAHEHLQRSVYEQQLCQQYASSTIHHLRMLAKTAREENNVFNSKSQKTMKVSLEPQTYTGSKKGLVILVEFPNLPMAYDDINNRITEMFNEPGYNKNNHIGSVHDYFLDQSYGKFNLNFDIVGPFLSTEDYGYYGRNSEIYGGDVNVRELIREACLAADPYVNYSDYDWDNDGTVDQVFIIYAGYGEHAGAPANTIWPHKSILTNQLTLDGVNISTYACSSELSGTSGNTLSGIGVACHEFSHCLGLPDLYDVNYNGGFGMDYWDVMNSGSHSGPKGNAEVPYGYSAYERWFCGWMDLNKITESGHIEELANLAESPSAYIVRNKGNNDEYYILENHQADRWYSYLGNNKAGHGMLITHIDYDPKAWRNNNVNTRLDHQRVTIIPADNKYDHSIRGLLGDPFPGTSDVTYLDNNTHINAGGHLYNVNSDGTYNMNIALSDITEQNGLISFYVSMGDIKPIAMDEVERDADGFWAEWTKIDQAESYTIDYSIVFSLIPLNIVNRQVENISTTRYHIPWEGKPLNINYKVKANIPAQETPWSNTATIKYKEETGINDILAEDIQNERYTLTGIKCLEKAKGVTLIRYKNGKTKKYFEK